MAPDISDHPMISESRPEGAKGWDRHKCADDHCPGTPIHILACLCDWAVELGHDPFSAKHPATFIREHVASLEAELQTLRGEHERLKALQDRTQHWLEEFQGAASTANVQAARLAQEKAELEARERALREALVRASCVESKQFPDHWCCVGCGAWYDYTAKECLGHTEGCYIDAALAPRRG